MVVEIWLIGFMEKVMPKIYLIMFLRILLKFGLHLRISIKFSTVCYKPSKLRIQEHIVRDIAGTGNRTHDLSNFVD